MVRNFNRAGDDAWLIGPHMSSRASASTG
jgi:hypothetical protein